MSIGWLDRLANPDRPILLGRLRRENLGANPKRLA